ncbi:MAG: acyl dehydratase [Sphingomonadales bacterium]|nr:acyl dehydratase [Sphingomonadales bacterium]
MVLVPEQISFNVTDEAIQSYARLTCDFNPLHVDPEFAARSTMNGVIAHGTMISNLLWLVLEANYGPAHATSFCLSVRYLAPARPGMHLIAGGAQTQAEPVTFDLWVRDESGRTLITGTATGRTLNSSAIQPDKGRP